MKKNNYKVGDKVVIVNSCVKILNGQAFTIVKFKGEVAVLSNGRGLHIERIRHDTKLDKVLK